MKKRDLFLILIGITIISFIFDDDIVILVDSIRNGYLDSFFAWVTNVASTVVILIVMTSLLLWETRKREWILPLWLSFILSGLITFLLKVTVSRTRPFQAYSQV
jgi:hypothetical protein